MISSPRYSCDVFGYDDGKTATNVPVGTCATVVTTAEGLDVLLVAHETLYFGESMRRSLINPNQLRCHGIQVQDDFTREDEDMAITIGQLMKIPLETEGITIYFESRRPTDAEIDQKTGLPRVEITSSYPWDPKKVNLRVASSSIRKTQLTDDLQTVNSTGYYTSDFKTDISLRQISSIYTANVDGDIIATTTPPCVHVSTTS